MLQTRRFSGRFSMIALGVIAAGALLSPLQGQVWELDAPGTDVQLYADASGLGYCDGNTLNCPVVTDGTHALQDYLGWDRAWLSQAYCFQIPISCALLNPSGAILIGLDGVGTSQVTILCAGVATTKFYCCQWSSWHEAIANARTGDAVGPIPATIGLTVAGVPPGTPVTANFTWWSASANYYAPEGIGDDSAWVASTLLALGGTALVPFSALDLLNVNGVLFRWGRGQFQSAGGASVSAVVSADLHTDIYPPPSLGAVRDEEYVCWAAEIVLSLAGPPIVWGPPALEFSADIGSDRELSDPQAAAELDEVFDPGDMYLWGGPALPAGGADGTRDDSTLDLGSDPNPNPPDGPPPATGAPTCSDLPPSFVAPDWFDLDGSDSLDFSLIGFIPPTNPLPFPIPRLSLEPCACIHRAQFLVLSYDDDEARHYSGWLGDCEVPVTSASPLLGWTYGSNFHRDEAVGLILIPAVPPLTAGALYPAASEGEIHTSLSPDPPAPAPGGGEVSQNQDDDVDALDITDGRTCTTWLLSFDHEAWGSNSIPALSDPGAVYEVVPGGPPVQVIDPVIHLGLAGGVDIDAFEFVWTFTDTAGNEVLTLLFSVNDDDPATPEDESAGLDPGLLYASYLTGSSFEFFDVQSGGGQLNDDLDAIAAWRTPLPPAAPPGEWRRRERAELTASDASAAGRFGWSVAVDADTIVIGAPYDNVGANADQGSAYVFEEGAGGWAQVAKLAASDGAGGDEFGGSVALSGDRALVGAEGDDDHGDWSGAAYVFEKVAGVWTQVAKLTASDGAAYDDFGHSVAVSGDQALVGANLDDDHGSWSGAAYVFEKVAGVWTQVAKLTASDGAGFDEFGESVALSADTALIGTQQGDGNEADSGCAYVFQKVGDLWRERAKLAATDGAYGDYFGHSVCLSGDTALVGALFDDDNGVDSGSAYVFQRIGGLWTQEAKLTPSDGAAGDSFGCSVGLSNDMALVGAYLGNNGVNSGSAYLFEALRAVERMGPKQVRPR
ncbi:MAG: FG-GAP repeat protein [Planctomycetota bacterium]